MYTNEEKTLFGDQNLVSGALFTGVSRQKATWEKIYLGALPRDLEDHGVAAMLVCHTKKLMRNLLFKGILTWL